MTFRRSSKRVALILVLVWGCADRPRSSEAPPVEPLDQTFAALSHDVPSLALSGPRGELLAAEAGWLRPPGAGQSASSRAGVYARLAPNFAEGVRVWVDDPGRHFLAFVPEGAHASGVEHRANRVRYLQAWPATDVLYEVQ